MTVKEAVTELKDSFEDFKTKDAPAIEEKMDGVEKRLMKLEASTKRPALETKATAEDSAEFKHYLQKGEMETKALSSTTDADGGYLIPHVVSDQIKDFVSQESVMRQVAKSMSISTDSVDLLVSQDDADAGWVTETEERGETKTPKLSKIRISVHEMYAKPRATQKLLDDATVNLEAWIAGKISTKMAGMENQAFIHGSGDKQPKGFLTYDVVYDGTSPWGKLQGFKTGADGAFEAGRAQDVLVDIVASLKPEYLGGAKWLMPRCAVAAIAKLKDKNGQSLWNPNLNEKAHASLLGYPVVICDDMPALDSEKPSIAFGNFQEGYQIVDRAGTRIMRDPYSAKPYIEFYTTRRVGGDVVNFEAIKVLSFNK